MKTIHLLASLMRQFNKLNPSQFLQGLILAIAMATSFSACEETKCEAGYFMNNKTCTAVNMKYVGTGTAVAETLENGVAVVDMNITLSASATSPYNFTLTRFKGIIKNDLVFTVSSTDDGVLTPLVNVSNSSGNTYNLSGTKVGSTVTLTIVEPGVGGATYVLKYGA